MAQSFTAKKQTYLNRLSQALTTMAAAADALQVLETEFTNNGYGSGGANAMVDADVQANYPASTAAILFFVMGSFANANAILPLIATARQSMETLHNS